MVILVYEIVRPARQTGASLGHTVNTGLHWCTSLNAVGFGLPNDGLETDLNGPRLSIALALAETNRAVRARSGIRRGQGTSRCVGE